VTVSIPLGKIFIIIGGGATLKGGSPARTMTGKTFQNFIS